MGVVGPEPADHGDLLAVDGDGRIAVEPAVGQPPGEPLRGIGRVGLICVLPASRPASTTSIFFHELHNYIIT
jgi:hypothetical protein